MIVQWVRMGDGIWDCAFAETGDQSVAIPLEGNPFGAHPYIGNYTLKAMAGQTMADAYDAVIFLAPLEKQRKSAWLAELFTPEFKQELARRINIMYTREQLVEKLASNGVRTVEELVDSIAEAEPEQPLPQAAAVASRDSWRDHP
jgi:hypothetical protein